MAKHVEVFYDSSAVIVSGDKRLWAAVLVRAMVDFVGDGPNSQCAYRWIMSGGTDEGSFVWVCEILDLDAVSVREFVRSGDRSLIEGVYLGGQKFRKGVADYSAERRRISRLNAKRKANAVGG